MRGKQGGIFRRLGKPSDCKADERLMGRRKKSLKLQGWAKKVLMKLRVCPRAPFCQELTCLGSLPVPVWQRAANGKVSLY